MSPTRREFLRGPIAAALSPLSLGLLRDRDQHSGRIGLSAAGSSRRSPRTLLTIDASKPEGPPQPSTFELTNGTAPGGRTIGLNNQYLTLAGSPWLPVMGEFHFSRYPVNQWEDELLKMKAGGIQIVATYVFWIHQEEIKGQFDWSGQRDLRRFIELCRKHGLYAFARIGPWSHGEVRNGGFPDWLLHSCPALRTNDPCYLGYVRTYFGEIGRQLSGLFWKDGGPVIGIQLENEYTLRGPKAGAAHIAEIKRIARQSGMDAPLYTVTGWGNPEFPPAQVIPVFGGYPDAFWARTLCTLPPSADYFFSSIRDDGAIGANLSPLYPLNPEILSYPYLTAELGGGMETSYHRRPVMSADDVAALALCKLGSGANLLGYYMYHGGANPKGKLTTLQESQATRYPNDLPVVSYDFQAPLGEFGQVRPSYGALKILHLFLQDFGGTLAPMAMKGAAVQPVSIYDAQTLRLAARTRKNHGFIFFNNYQRNYRLAEHPAIQVALQLPLETVTVPAQPTNLPAGAFGIWPVNLNLNGALLKYSTAQLLCKASERDTQFYFFFALPGIEIQFVLERATLASIRVHRGVQSREGRLISVRGVTPATDAAMTLRSKAGKVTKVVVLTREQAEGCYRLPFAGAERIFITPGDIFVDRGHLHVRAHSVTGFSFLAFPGLNRLSATAPLRELSPDGIFTRHGLTIAPKTFPVRAEQIRSALPLGPPRMGKQVALAPADSDFDRAAEWRIHVPPNALDGLAEMVLRIEYVGDVGRLYAGRQLLDDNFYNGAVWEVGLKRFASSVAGREINLQILPLRKGAPMYLPRDAWPSFPPDGQIAVVKRVSLAQEYEVIVSGGTDRDGEESRSLSSERDFLRPAQDRLSRSLG